MLKLLFIPADIQRLIIRKLKVYVYIIYIESLCIENILQLQRNLC